MTSTSGLSLDSLRSEAEARADIQRDTDALDRWRSQNAEILAAKRENDRRTVSQYRELIGAFVGHIGDADGANLK